MLQLDAFTIIVLLEIFTMLQITTFKNKDLHAINDKSIVNVNQYEYSIDQYKLLAKNIANNRLHLTSVAHIDEQSTKTKIFDTIDTCITFNQINDVLASIQ